MAVKIYALYRKDIAECMEIVRTQKSSVDEIAGRFMFAYFVALKNAMEKTDDKKLPLAVGDASPFADMISIGNSEKHLAIGIEFRAGCKPMDIEMELPFGDHPTILVKPMPT